MSADCDPQLADGDDQCGCPLEYDHGRWREVEVGQFRLADDGKANERSTYKYFVSGRVGHSSEFTGDVISSCDVSVDDVGKAGYDEKYEGDEKETGWLGPIHIAGVNDHEKEYDGQYEPADRQSVWYEPNYSLVAFSVHLPHLR